MNRRLLALALAATLVASACTSATPVPTSSARSPSPTAALATASPATGAAATAAPATDAPPAATPPSATIPQPDVGDLPVAPESERVDIAMPTFTNPTSITNPFFPVSSQESVLLLGEVDGQAFRTEVTLLPLPRIIHWEGLLVATLVSQYVAYLDGRIHEVAYDLYAQADDGSVWYFGEDVFNFDGGAIVDTHGTWIAGIDGPAAMIMPADPQVGDVYRPENIPGFVFEEVTVTEVGRTVDGPLGPIDGALVVDELHMDGSHEEKIFAPAYGEFYTAGGGDIEALALAVPTDAAAETVPAELALVYGGAYEILAAGRRPDWAAAATVVEDLTSAWDTYRATGIPALIEPVMDDALADLDAAIGDRDAAQARQAAIEVAQSSLDLQLRHRPALEVDIARFDLWAAQLQLDAQAGQDGAVNGDVFSLDYVRDRILFGLDTPTATNLNLLLEELSEALAEADLEAAADVGGRLRELIGGG